MLVLKGAGTGLSQVQDPVKFIRASRYTFFKIKITICSVQPFLTHTFS